MDKQEFIQQAALILLQHKHDEPADSLADYVKNYADAIYDACDEQKTDEPAGSSEDARPLPSVPDLNDEHIEVLIREIRKIEEENIKTARYRTQIAGLDVRVINALRPADIHTVGDLLRFGRRSCSKLRTLGPKSVKYIDQALKNLYGIETW